MTGWSILRLTGPHAVGSAQWREISVLRHELLAAEGKTLEEVRANDLESVHFVASRDGAVVGAVQYDPARNRLRQMIVAPAARGSGLGRALVAAVEAEARSRGRRELLVHAWLRSRGFYRRLGFVECGEPRLAERVPWVPMAIDLGS